MSMKTLGRLKELFAGYQEIVTVREVAFVIRCSEDYILALISQNTIPHFMVGSHFRIFKEDIILYFSSNSKTTKKQHPPKKKEKSSL